ncbi:MAG: Mut7-C RNAse domain-containing protein [Thermoproteota archaeon]
MNPRFVIDGMHGYLAKWLRIMGYDTLYMDHVEDEVLIKIASDGRILITSDVELAQRAYGKGIHTILVKGLNEDESLRLVVKNLKLSFREDSLRCTVCNGKLITISREEASKIARNIPKSMESFWKCESCDKIYWKGSHWKNILRKIFELTG